MIPVSFRIVITPRSLLSFIGGGEGVVLLFFGGSLKLRRGLLDFDKIRCLTLKNREIVPLGLSVYIAQRDFH